MRQLVVIITALLIPILPFVIIGELPGERWLSAVDDNALLFGLTGSGLLALDIFLPIPSSILGTILGARLGFWPGTLCTWTGLVAGNLLGFGVALALALHDLPQEDFAHGCRRFQRRQPRHSYS